MKTRLLCLFIINLFSFAKCNKDKDANGLPPATQEGKNTLGFLVDGQPWVPSGNVGFSANLSIDIDLRYNNGTFSLAAYKIVSSDNKESFGIGIKDSLNLMSIPITLSLSKTSLYGARFATKNCSIDFFDTNVSRVGSLTINKLDRTNRIIAGIFNATLSKSGCSIIQITEGRFDMKY